MNKWLKYFVYLSLLFLLYSLWKADYLKMPDILSYPILFVSFAFLFAGYYTKSMLWKVGLKTDGIKVTLRDSLASTGLAEFGKYIPGKLWVILGRALYVSQHYSITIQRASAISLNVQMLTIWSGLLIGLIGMFFVNIPLDWLYLMLAGWIILSLILFIPRIHILIQNLADKIFKKKKLEIPLINIGQNKKILLWFILDWIVRMTGFYFLVCALSPVELNYAIATGYPLAVTLGILAIIAPGGVGVREGILVLWLSNSGIGWEIATSLAIATRLWTLIGEISIFALGLVLKKKQK